jgi:4'-phosphopantetheinyl transferase
MPAPGIHAVTGPAPGPIPRPLRFGDAPAAHPVLGADEAHVWYADLRLPGERLAALAALLSPEERARAARFHRDADRDAFVARRGLLRSLLSRYLGCRPEALAFAVGPSGRPMIAGDDSDSTPAFSVSRSAHLALFAFAHDAPVGVDLERWRDDVDVDAIPARFFAPEEIAELDALRGEQRRRAFFDGWTRKEAFLKARGTGLSTPLRAFAVSCAGQPRLLRIDDVTTSPADWHVVSVTMPDAFSAALVVGRCVRRLAAWSVPATATW